MQRELSLCCCRYWCFTTTHNNRLRFTICGDARDASSQVWSLFANCDGKGYVSSHLFSLVQWHTFFNNNTTPPHCVTVAVMDSEWAGAITAPQGPPQHLVRYEKQRRWTRVENIWMSVGLTYQVNVFQGIPLLPQLTRTPFQHLILMNPLHHYNGIINIKNLYFFQCYAIIIVCNIMHLFFSSLLSSSLLQTSQKLIVFNIWI